MSKQSMRSPGLPNVLPVKSMGLVLKKEQNGGHCRLFENHKDALKLATSNLNKRYMARKARLIVIWPSFENKMPAMFNVRWGYAKKSLYLRYPSSSQCENNLLEVMAIEYFEVWNLTFEPCFKTKWSPDGHHIISPYIFLIISRRASEYQNSP